MRTGGKPSPRLQLPQQTRPGDPVMVPPRVPAATTLSALRPAPGRSLRRGVLQPRAIPSFPEKPLQPDAALWHFAACPELSAESLLINRFCASSLGIGVSAPVTRFQDRAPPQWSRGHRRGDNRLSHRGRAVESGFSRAGRARPRLCPAAAPAGFHHPEQRSSASAPRGATAGARHLSGR